MNLLQVDTIDQVEKKLACYFGVPGTGGEEEGAAAGRPASERVPLSEAPGRYLAEDIIAGENIPPFARSVVDGYAVFSRDTFGASDAVPVFLQVAAQVPMGALSERVLRPGEAAYVPTGGALPEGADAVVMVEFAELLDETTVAVGKSAAPGANVMEVGGDVRQGSRLYSTGRRIRPRDVGVLAALGHETLEVFVRPVVSILSTGDELVNVCDTPAPGQMRDVNTPALAALIRESGALVGEACLVGDDEGAIEAALRNALAGSDLVLVSGGSSAGNKDMTAKIIAGMGRPGVITHGVAMKPGKPTIIGVLSGDVAGVRGSGTPKLVVGLPGHPMAAVTVYRVLIDPFLRKYFFCASPTAVTVRALLAENLPGGEGRESFVMVRLREGKAEPIHAKSGAISQFAAADGYVRVQALTEGIKAGEETEVVLL